MLFEENYPFINTFIRISRRLILYTCTWIGFCCLSFCSFSNFTLFFFCSCCLLLCLGSWMLCVLVLCVFLYSCRCLDSKTTLLNKKQNSKRLKLKRHSFECFGFQFNCLKTRRSQNGLPSFQTSQFSFSSYLNTNYYCTIQRNYSVFSVFVSKSAFQLTHAL